MEWHIEFLRGIATGIGWAVLIGWGLFLAWLPYHGYSDEISVRHSYFKFGFFRVNVSDPVIRKNYDLLMRKQNKPGRIWEGDKYIVHVMLPMWIWAVGRRIGLYRSA